MQLTTLTGTMTLLALLFTTSSASPRPDSANALGRRNACRRSDGAIVIRELDGSLVERADGCTLANAGGPGAPLPNAWCKANYGSEFPCCVENGIGGALCTDCTHGIHNC